MTTLRRVLSACALVALVTVPCAAQYDSSYSGHGTFNVALTAPTLTATTTIVAGTTVTGTSGGVFGVVGTHDRILISPAVKGAGQFDATITSFDLTAAREWKFPNAGGTVALTSDATDGSLAVAGSSLTAGVVGTHDRIITTPVAKGSNQFDGTTTSEDLTAARTWTFPNSTGTVSLRSTKSLYTLIQGGFTLGGTLTSTASTITVTVVDTTATITDGDVQVCGYATAGAQTSLTKTCETIDFSGGAAATATTATFVTVTNIKASSFATLGGSGDETIAAKWTTGDVAILAAVNLTNSALSDFVTTPIAVAETFWNPLCLDLQGCNVEPADLTAAEAGRTLTVVGRDATLGLVFSDAANMDILASGAFTAGVGDTIVLVYAPSNAKAWVEVSRTNN